MLNFRKNDKNKINTIYQPDEKIQFDREMVYKRFGLMKDAKVWFGVPLDRKYDEWEKQYEAYREPRDPGDWQSNIYPPLTCSIIEQELAEIVGQTIRPKASPRGPEDKHKARLANYISDYTWEIGQGDLELADSFKQCLVLGNTVWQEDFWVDKRMVQVVKKLSIEENKQKLEFENKEVFDFNDVYGETVDIRNFFLDPGARTINRGRKKANDCIRRYIMNIDTFNETFKGSIFDMFGVVDLVKVGVTSDYWQYYQPPSGIKNDDVECLFYWGRRPDKLIIIANDVVIYDGPNPYNHKQLPFAAATDVTRLRGFWGRGEAELLESIQDELTTNRRMRIDRNHIDLFKMFLVSDRETLDDDEAVVAPSRFMYVTDPNNIKSLDYKEMSANAYMEEDRLKQDGREVTGVTSPQPAGTATEAAIFKESTMKILQKKVWRFGKEFLWDIMALRYPNIVQFYTEPKIEEIVGEVKASEFRRIETNNIEIKMTNTGELVEERKKGTYFFDVKPEDIKPYYGLFNLKYTSEPSFPLSKPLRQQQTDKFFASPLVSAAIKTGYYDLNKAVDMYAEEYDYDPDDLKKVTVEQGQGGGVNDQLLIEMAGKENELMLDGRKLPPTPYSIRAHTDLHLAFMDSEPFKKAVQADMEIMRAFLEHIMGEATAQKLRGGGTPDMGNEGASAEELAYTQNNGSSTSEGIMNGPAKAMNPAKVQGAEFTPTGMMQK
jgi:hypothetical protein